MPKVLVFMLANETISKVLGETSLRTAGLKGLPYLERRSGLTLENVKIYSEVTPRDSAPDVE
jgi:hypothetical protein